MRAYHTLVELDEGFSPGRINRVDGGLDSLGLVDGIHAQFGRAAQIQQQIGGAAQVGGHDEVSPGRVGGDLLEQRLGPSP